MSEQGSVLGRPSVPRDRDYTANFRVIKRDWRAVTIQKHLRTTGNKNRKPCMDGLYMFL